jgi:predicted CXXCH cytochrome family protein
MMRAVVIAFLFALLAAGQTAPAFSEDSGLVPTPPKGRGEHCVAPTEFMRRNHMSMMKHQRDETVHEGVRGKPFSLAGCMECHAVKGADGQPVTYSDSKHFCRTCHDFAAVSIDCFQCHSSRPGSDKPQSAQRAVPADLAVAATVFEESRP